ncbi:hypothetical protein [Enterococcus sp. AZ072]|uniref:hypothetical protein n=1 Tax=unclassified Enterococcus TaxID=2608891 RepID=UPI003D29E84B
MRKQMSYFFFVVGAVLISSLIEVLKRSMTLYAVLGYGGLLVFFALTYLFTQKWLVGRYEQLGIYTIYWFLVSTFGSLILAEKSASFLLLFLYFGLSFIGALSCCAILPWLFTKKKIGILK